MLADIQKILFGPAENISDFVISEINKAQYQIKIMAFWFTWKPIADAILRAHSRGVKISLILDSRSAEEKLKDVDKERELIVPKYLIDNGINESDIKIYNGELLHHKIVLIDEDRVLTGSCNFFNASINRHEEHYMSIKSKELYDIFCRRYQHLWDHQTNKFELNIST